MRLTIEHLYLGRGTQEIYFHVPTLSPEIPLEETEKKIDMPQDNGLSQDVFFENMWINHSTVSLESSTKFRLRYDFPFVLLQFVLAGHSLEEKTTEEQTPHVYKAQHHSIVYSNALEGVHEHAACNHIELVRIHLSPSFFLQLLPANEVFDVLKERISKGKFHRLFESDLPIAPSMLLAIRELIGLKSKGTYKRWILEAKVIQLIVQQLEQYEKHCHAEHVLHTMPHDIEGKMHKAKTIILDNLQKPLTLHQLAYQVGTNECYLKKSFKEMFGTTVFGFLFMQKMEYAKEMLLNSTCTVHQVSERVGYKNPNHFSAAFKKHFGFLPSDLKSSK